MRSDNFGESVDSPDLTDSHSESDSGINQSETDCDQLDLWSNEFGVDHVTMGVRELADSSNMRDMVEQCIKQREQKHVEMVIHSAETTLSTSRFTAGDVRAALTALYTKGFSNDNEVTLIVAGSQAFSELPDEIDGIDVYADTTVPSNMCVVMHGDALEEAPALSEYDFHVRHGSGVVTIEKSET